MERKYSRVVVIEVKYPHESIKRERFMVESGEMFYKESTFNIKKNHNGKVQYIFSYNGYDATLFSFFNVFAYYLGYKGNIDDDLKMYTRLPIFEDYEEENYYLKFTDKNDTSICIESNIEKAEIKIYMKEGAIYKDAGYYDDIVAEASARFFR